MGVKQACELTAQFKLRKNEGNEQAKVHAFANTMRF